MLTLNRNEQEQLAAKVAIAKEARAEAFRLLELALKGKQVLPSLETWGIYGKGEAGDKLIGKQIGPRTLKETLGAGLSRVGFLTDHGTVIKVPRSEDGHKENILESYLLARLAPLGVTNRLYSRNKFTGMPCIEVERLEQVSAMPKDNMVAAGKQWIELATIARLGLELTDWLQIGYSPSKKRWVLTDIAPPDGCNRQGDFENKLYHDLQPREVY